MASKIVLLFLVVAFVNSHAQLRRHKSGGCDIPPDDCRFPIGGYSEMVGYKAGPLWGSLHQEHKHIGLSSPITYKAGADFLNSQGHGLSGKVSLESGKGGEGTLRGGFPIVDSPIHKVDVFAQIDRNLNKNLNPTGPEINAFEVKYKNVNGATATFSQTQTHGKPAVKTIEASIPVVHAGDHLLKVTGQNNIGQKQTLGIKYDNQASGATVSLSGNQNNVGPARGTAEASIPVNVGPATVTFEGQSTFGHGMKPDSQVGVKVSIPLD